MSWFRRFMNKHYGWKYVMYKANFKGEYLYIPCRVYKLQGVEGYYIHKMFQMYPLKPKGEGIIWYKLYW